MPIRVGVPMPSATDGATPHRSLVTASRPGVLESVHIAFSLKAAPSRPTSGWLKSSVPRLWSEDPMPIDAVRDAPRFGVLVARLIMPPVEPRPAIDDDGPLTTSTCSTLNG